MEHRAARSIKACDCGPGSETNRGMARLNVENALIVVGIGVGYGGGNVVDASVFVYPTDSGDTR